MFKINLTPTVLTVVAIAALSACAQMPAGITPAQPQGAFSGNAMAAAPGGEKMAMMDVHMKSMRDMHERMTRARSPDERQAMRAEHMKMMQDGMAMMGGMGDAARAKEMKGMHGTGTMPSDIEARQQMMEKHMEMMRSMMQMMMDQMPPNPAKP